MKYKTFEELPVWQDAIELAVRVYDLTARPQFKGYYTIKDQLERASVSVSNNIAEGFERGTRYDSGANNLSLHLSWIVRRNSIGASFVRSFEAVCGFEI